MTLARSTIKAADRVGGVELMLPWPTHVRAPADLSEDEEQDVGEAEWAYARALLGIDRYGAGSVDPLLIRLSATLARRPPGIPDALATVPHLAARLVTPRWSKVPLTQEPPIKWWVPPGWVARGPAEPRATARATAIGAGSRSRSRRGSAR